MLWGRLPDWRFPPSSLRDSVPSFHLTPKTTSGAKTLSLPSLRLLFFPSLLPLPWFVVPTIFHLSYCGTGSWLVFPPPLVPSTPPSYHSQRPLRAQIRPGFSPAPRLPCLWLGQICNFLPLPWPCSSVFVPQIGRGAASPCLWEWVTPFLLQGLRETLQPLRAFLRPEFPLCFFAPAFGEQHFCTVVEPESSCC